MPPQVTRVQNLPTPNTRGGERRRRILTALHDCIINKGYSKTTLADVAQAADMTPSHLLYYFRGKDAILEQYFDNVADRILERIDEFSHQAPERQIELLGELFFAGNGINHSEIGFMLECFGVAVHDETLHREKANLDRQLKVYLKTLFKTASPEFTNRAEDSAELAYAMLMGLLTAAYFDDRLGLPQARRLFGSSMLNLANPVSRS